jgi:hypothetical protein
MNFNNKLKKYMNKINENNITTYKQKYIFYKNLNGEFQNIKFCNSIFLKNNLYLIK